jgi:hypothetical protein
MSATRSRRSFGHIVAHAAQRTPHVITLGTTLATALLLGNVWLAIAGSWLYVLLVARTSTSPRFWRELSQAEAELSRQLPPETSLTDPSLQLVVRAIRKGRDEVGRIIAETPEPGRSELAPLLSSVDDLCVRAVQLVRDADDLSRYLLTGPREAALTAIEKLHQDIARASDEGGKAQYVAALSGRQDQLASLAHVALEQERIVAALQFIVTTIEGLPAWIYRMRVLDSRVKEDRVSEAFDELTRMKVELTGSLRLLEGLAHSADG